MRSLLRLTFLILLCYFVSQPALSGQAEAGNPAGKADVPLTEQLDLMVDKSNRYQRFRVVPSNWLAAFKQNLSDSLALRSAQTDSLLNTIASLESRLKTQEEAIATKDADIARLNEEKDGIQFLGATVSKTLYNVVVWGLAALLLGGLLFFLGRSRYAVAISRELENSNSDLTSELDQAKRRRLEVEQDLRRKLQDERNKNKGA